MPSDARYAAALAALARPIAEFRALVHDALAQVDAFLALSGADAIARAERAARELGVFAVGRIEPARFAELFPAVPPAGAEAREALDRAAQTLGALAARGEGAFQLDLPKGGKLGPAIDLALSEFGRAFGAVMVVEAVRGGHYDPATHAPLLDLIGFHAWGKEARRFAPPLLVTLDGADLHPGTLTDYADGRQKIVLVVRGPAAPAPLARCITPGTLVLQTVDGSGLDRVAAFDGPAIAAVLPEGSAVFLHDPVAGRDGWQRLTLRTLGEAPKRPVGGTSVWQMTEDRTLLEELARTPFAIPAPGGAPAPALGADEAVDRLAAWLLAPKP